MKNKENLASKLFTKSMKIKSRLSFLIFLAFIFSAYANPFSFSQTRISIDVENEKIVKVLDEIEAETDFKFIYQLNIYDFDKKVSIKVENELIKNVLDNIFQNEIDYNILDKKILLLKKEKVVQEDVAIKVEPEIIQRVISGTIKDDQGNPLPGATIIIVGTQNGAVTDFDGNFSLDIENDSANLEVSYVGYQKQIISIGNQNNIEIF